MNQIFNSKGDILVPTSYLDSKHHSEHVLIVHGCNALGVMGAGLALQVKAKSPKAFTVYEEACNTAVDKHLLLGTYTHARDLEANLTIINAILQLNVGKHKRQVNYEAVARVFERIADVMTEHSDRDFYLAIPKNLGCGLAGGNWNIVSTIILETLKDVPNCNLYIVEWDN